MKKKAGPPNKQKAPGVFSLLPPYRGMVFLLIFFVVFLNDFCNFGGFLAFRMDIHSQHFGRKCQQPL